MSGGGVTLTGAGASDELAEAFVRVAQDAGEQLDVATKADVRREIAGLRAEIANLDTSGLSWNEVSHRAANKAPATIEEAGQWHGQRSCRTVH